MGLMDNIRGFFSGSRNMQTAQTRVQVNEDDEKSRLADRIVELVGKIKRINSFDSSIWSISNASNFELKRKSLEELQKINSNLERRFSDLNKQSQRIDPNREALEASKWTGQQPANMSNHDFDRFQNDDGR